MPLKVRATSAVLARRASRAPIHSRHSSQDFMPRRRIAVLRTQRAILAV